MKKILIIWIFLQAFYSHAMFVGLQDDSSQNRFAGLDYSSCSVSGQNAYSCGNSTISNLLNINFFSPIMYGKQFYFWNDYVYWIGAQSKALEYYTTALRLSQSQADNKIKDDFPAPGIYMIVLGTSGYLQQIIAPDKTCPAGQLLMMAQLKYNNGDQIYAWSQDAVCLNPQDSFVLQVSSGFDTTIPMTSDDSADDTTADVQGVNWMKCPGPTSIYNKATKSPRKIRIVKSGS